MFKETFDIFKISLKIKHFFKIVGFEMTNIDQFRGFEYKSSPFKISETKLYIYDPSI